MAGRRVACGLCWVFSALTQLHGADGSERADVSVPPGHKAPAMKRHGGTGSPACASITTVAVKATDLPPRGSCFGGQNSLIYQKAFSIRSRDCFMKQSLYIKNYHRLIVVIECLQWQVASAFFKQNGETVICRDVRLSAAC
jgi:hypothetical protein